MPRSTSGQQPPGRAHDEDNEGTAPDEQCGEPKDEGGARRGEELVAPDLEPKIERLPAAAIDLAEQGRQLRPEAVDLILDGASTG